MDSDEIERLLDTSVEHSVVVDVRDVGEAPGHLRTVTIHQGYSVTIEFQTNMEYVEGNTEGAGLKYVGRYETLEELLRDLELFLDKRVAEWRNYSLMPFRPPTVVPEADPTATLAYFEDLVRRSQLKLPAAGSFELAGVYWRHIELFGEYRPDKLGEETDRALRTRDPRIDE